MRHTAAGVDDGFLADAAPDDPDDLLAVLTSQRIDALLNDPNNAHLVAEHQLFAEAGCRALEEIKGSAELFRLGHSTPEIRERRLEQWLEKLLPTMQLYGTDRAHAQDPTTLLAKIVQRVQESMSTHRSSQKAWLQYGIS